MCRPAKAQKNISAPDHECWKPQTVSPQSPDNGRGRKPSNDQRPRALNLHGRPELQASCPHAAATLVRQYSSADPLHLQRRQVLSLSHLKARLRRSLSLLRGTACGEPSRCQSKREGSKGFWHSDSSDSSTHREGFRVVTGAYSFYEGLGLGFGDQGDQVPKGNRLDSWLKGCSYTPSLRSLKRVFKKPSSASDTQRSSRLCNIHACGAAAGSAQRQETQSFVSEAEG